MKLIPYSDLKEKKGIKYSRVHVSRLEKADKFPKHVNLGPQSIGWLESEVDDWIAAKAAERSEKPAQASTGNEVDPEQSAEERKAENARCQEPVVPR
jgi:prophage regulatory protein